MKPVLFNGCGTAIITPMKDDLSIHYELFGELLDQQLQQGSDAIVVAGTTGESATLTDEEHIELIRYAVKRVHGRIPVIAGAGSNNTAHAVHLSKEAERAGADALLHVTPYYNKTSQKGLYLHFRACAEATKLPVILYNVPTRTGMNILPETYFKLSQIENIVAAKEASGKEEGFTIGIAFANENGARWHYDEKFMVETIEAAGGKALVQWANYDQTKQENQVDNLITQGIDALILIAVSSNMSATVEKVKEEGIPVVCYDNFVENAPLDAYLDRDNVEAGRIQMKAAMEAIGGKGKIAIIHGEPTSSVVLGMKKGYDEVLASYPDVEVVLEQYCEGYSAEKALKYAENALSANNDDIQAIVCTADVLTLGILPALESAGLAGQVFLTGMDCEVAAMQAVNKQM